MLKWNAQETCFKMKKNLLELFICIKNTIRAERIELSSTEAMAEDEDDRAEVMEKRVAVVC